MQNVKEQYGIYFHSYSYIAIMIVRFSTSPNLWEKRKKRLLSLFPLHYRFCVTGSYIILIVSTLCCDSSLELKTSLPIISVPVLLTVSNMLLDRFWLTNVIDPYLNCQKKKKKKNPFISNHGHSV